MKSVKGGVPGLVDKYKSIAQKGQRTLKGAASVNFNCGEQHYSKFLDCFQ